MNAPLWFLLFLAANVDDRLGSDEAEVSLRVSWPLWASMWAIAICVFAIAKAMSYLPARRLITSPGRLAGYWFAWPGLDASAFLTLEKREASVAFHEWLFAWAKMMTGVALLVIAARVPSKVNLYLVGWVAMIGIAFTLHFGLFHLLSCYWRSQGVDAKPLMNWPIFSQGLSDFWGKRWNRAFRDLTHRFVFRPLTSRFGIASGSLLAFLFSGLIHELAITVPAGGCYGGPTIYFLVQGFGLLVEHSKFGRQIGLASGWRGRLFAGVVILSPVSMLFPRLFVLDVVVPFLQSLAATS